MGRTDDRVGKREILVDMQNNYDLFVRRWAWLFPFTFLFHINEEYYCGFSQWIARFTGVEVSPSQFLNLDVFFWLVMTAGIAASMLAPSVRWLAATFATVVFINGLTHLVGSSMTISYSPGMITGTIFWLPLGGYTLLLANKYLGRAQFTSSVITGILLHTIILILVFNAGKGPSW